MPPRLTRRITWIRGTAPSARLSAVSLDLTSLSAVRAAAAEIAALAPELHVLMNNAGVMFTPFGRTADGFEMQFGTNHLGHFALTQLLLPQLAADGSRVVNLSSDGHLMSDVDLDDPNWQHRDYDKFLAYGASKTANVLHAVELDRRYRDRGIRSYAVHPGIVATALARHMTRDDFAGVAVRRDHRRSPARTRRRPARLRRTRARRGDPGLGGGQPETGRHRRGVPRRLRRPL